MSKILVLTVPAEGHFNPFMPIISGLVKRGHEVVCFAGSVFQYRVEKTGATFRPPPAKWDFGETETYDFFPEMCIPNLISRSGIFYHMLICL